MEVRKTKEARGSRSERKPECLRKKRTSQYVIARSRFSKAQKPGWQAGGKGVSGHAERSEARRGGLFLLENKQKRILRFAQDDMVGGFFPTLPDMG